MNSDNIQMDYEGDASQNWMVETGGRYGTAVKNYLLADGIPENGADKIIHNAAKVLGYCPDPTKNCEQRLTGIVIGKVQSGKTSNFIALTALAFDNGYTHVVVFGGTKKVLVGQNSDRITEYFSACKDVIVLNTVEHKNQLNSDTLLQFTKHGKKVIIVALKTPQQINFIRNEVFSNPELADKETLIIDDEGDEASLNTLVNKGKKSSTYKAIENLKNTLRRHCFVSVTATPQANLLISSMDVLSPDFGVLVDPGKGYCGLDVFHGPNSKYIKEIPDNESSLLDEGVPQSFYEALATFFVACGIFKHRGIDPGAKLSMLIHPSQLKMDHDFVIHKTKTTIDNWRNSSQNKKDIAYMPVRKLLLQAYDRYKTETIPDVPKFEDIEDAILDAIDYHGLHKVNGDSVPNGIDKCYDYNIYVGGAMLGRGLTIKGLAVTYIIRTAKGVSTADTVTQRARWFGYKTKYLDLCRIFAVSKIIEEFKSIREHEEDIWDTVRDANLQGTHFKDIARIFVLSDNLKATRSNVATTESYTFKPWNIQKRFLKDKDYANSNRNILQQFRNSHLDILTTRRFGGDKAAPFIIAEGVPFDIVKTELVDKFVFPENSAFNGSVITKIVMLLRKKNVDAYVDVIWMRDGITSIHEIDEDGGLKNYFVGRRPENLKEPVVYAGDRVQFITPDRFQLQIHMIQDKLSGLISPTLALYIPEKCIEKLTNLVIRK